MEADRFFHEITREIAEIDDVNRYLREIVEGVIQEKIDEEYREFTAWWQKELYDEIYDDSFTWA